MRPEWRWRIVDYEGEMVAESHQTFPTITAAVATGTQRLTEMNAVTCAATARAATARAYRWSRQRRRR